MRSVGISFEQCFRFRNTFNKNEYCFCVFDSGNTDFILTRAFQIEAEAKPVTNQKSSGRCWIFACLNVIRLPFIKKYELEDFEFSQAYIFFWDKVGRLRIFALYLSDKCGVVE